MEYHSVCVPSSELGLPHPLFRKRVCPPPPEPGGGGAHSDTRLLVREWVSPRSDDWRKSLAHCLLCGSISNMEPEYVNLLRRP
jgi:hypothetical protein